MNRLPLAKVALCAVEAEVPALAAMALLQAPQGIAFGRVEPLTPGGLRTVVPPELELMVVSLSGRADVADFVACRRHVCVSPSQALILCRDTGVLNPGAWSDGPLVAEHLVPPGAPGDVGGLPGRSSRSRRRLPAGGAPSATPVPL